MSTTCPRCTGPIPRSVFVHRSVTDYTTEICTACSLAEERILETEAPIPPQSAWPVRAQAVSR